MLEAITFSGYKTSEADVTRFDLILGSLLLSERSFKTLEKAAVLSTESFFQATAILHAERKKPNSFILSWRLSKAPKEMIHQRNKVVCVLQEKTFPLDKHVCCFKSPICPTTDT